MTGLKKLIFIAAEFLIFIVMLIQIVLGIIWMTQNIIAVPLFGDTGEYLDLSQTFKLDEYRPILYPLFLNGILYTAKSLKIDFQWLVYAVQTFVNLIAIIYMVSVFFKAKNQGVIRYIFTVVFVSLYILTIPMITWFNFSILTDSFSLSALIIMLTALSRYIFEEKSSPLLWIAIGLSYIIQGLLRADRFYSCIVLILASIIFKFVKTLIHKKEYPDKLLRKAVLILFVPIIISALSFGAVKGVDSSTQTEGINGRIKTTWQFVLLDRVVWPNMSANYEYFNDNIKNTVTLKEANTFDEQNNRVMYQMAPLIESRAGKKAANDMYVEMAKTVFEKQPGKVIFDICEEIAEFVFMPVSVLLCHFNLCNITADWNIYCMSSAAPHLTSIYNNYYLFTYCLLLFPITIISFIVSKPARKMAKGLSLFIAMSILLALWFGLGDGAHPNDRYALIVFVTWMMLTLKQLNWSFPAFLNGSNKNNI